MLSCFKVCRRTFFGDRVLANIHTYLHIMYLCWPGRQGMTYYIKFIILYKDCLVMKIIGNRPITEADTNFSKISTKN